MYGHYITNASGVVTFSAVQIARSKAQWTRSLVDSRGSIVKLMYYCAESFGVQVSDFGLVIQDQRALAGY